MSIHICTKDDPWTPAKVEDQVMHPDANVVKQGGNGRTEAKWKVCHCPHCGKTFKVELAG